MTLIIALPTERKAWLQAEAQQRGLSAEECAGALLTDLLAEREAEAARCAADREEARRRLANAAPHPRRTLKDLQAHIIAQREAARQARKQRLFKQRLFQHVA